MWATEWVFFVIEVVGVYMLVYLASRVDRQTHLRLSIIFGLTSYTTMLVIVGILSFMLWPGKADWFTDTGVLNGFFGPNTFAQLAMRTAFMFTMTAWWAASSPRASRMRSSSAMWRASSPGSASARPCWVCCSSAGI